MLCCRSQLVELQEEGTEFGGYFIVNGIERVVRMLIQPRRHYILASRRSAYRKRGSSYTDAATVVRCGPALGSLTAGTGTPGAPEHAV